MLQFLTPLASLAGSWIDAKTTKQAAEAKLKLTEAEAKAKILLSEKTSVADWERIMAEGAKSSWKDEWFVIVLSIPLVLAFIPGAEGWVDRGFEQLSKAPDWYFYSLGSLLDTTYHGGPLIREQDLLEYRSDLEGVECRQRIGEVSRYRAHQRPGQELMWPLFECARVGKDLNRLGFKSVRGVFEKREAVVEQLTVRFRGQHLLVVTHPDDPEGKSYVLGELRKQAELGENYHAALHSYS